MKTVDVDLTELPNLTPKKFYPLYWDQSRYLVLMGGGGSGKSVFITQKIVMRMLSETGHRMLVLRKVAKTLRESVFTEIKKTIYRWGVQDLFKIPKGTSSELHISCVNGNEILFAGLDDVEKLKSISGVTSIWIEEASEITTDDFRQLDIRMRGKAKNYKQMMITFNPIDINHWLKKEFFDVKKQGSKTKHSTYKDNPFLPEEDRKVLEAFKETDPYFYQVYCLGEWGVLGKTIFPKQIVSERIAYLRNKKPLKRGYFVFECNDGGKPLDNTIKWIDDDQGAIKIYDEVKPHVPYVLGGDTAGEGSDNFTGHIIDNSTGKQAAVLKQQYDEIDYAKQMYCLGRHYNTALIGIENNFSTYPTRKMEEWNYQKMYVRQSEDTFTHKIKQSFGFVTGKITRPLIIANLVTIVKESVSLINDVETLEEMLPFVKNEHGRPEAQEGAHDDLLMGLAITYYIRDQQAYGVTQSVRIDISKLPQDLQDDYNRASADDKQRLARKWGLLKGA